MPITTTFVIMTVSLVTLLHDRAALVVVELLNTGVLVLGFVLLPLKKLVGLVMVTNINLRPSLGSEGRLRKMG